jgi:hypothetical protein
MEEECPNPLLLGWIKGWLDQARERNSKGVTVYIAADSPLDSSNADGQTDTKGHMSR